MFVRAVYGVVATLALLTAGQCQGPKPPDPPVIVEVPTTARGSAPVEPHTPPPVTVVKPPPTTSTTLAPAVRVGVPPVPVVPAPAASSWPHWRITADGVPYYSGRPACTVSQANEIAAQFVAVGASVSTARWAIYVASREGGCNYLAVHIGRTDDSHCTFQLNAKSGGPLSVNGLLGRLGWTRSSVKASLQACAQAAAALWSTCGKGPWIAGDYSCKEPTS